MASSGRGNNSLASMRKKRRTIGGFRAQAMGESFDHNNTTADASGNFSLSMVPENQLSCLGGDSAFLGAGSDHIVVAVRVRPLSSTEIAEGKRSCCEVLTRNTLVIRKGADPGAYLRSQQGSVNEYSFDAVFPPEAGQSEVYEGTAKPHISELLEGINVTVFAYGATGAGKTHTMMGSERVVGTRDEDGTAEVSGIVPQSLVELFRLLDERAEAGSGREDETESWSVRVGYLQVYNEQIMDLLSGSSKPLKINEDPAKGIVVVAGLVEMEVTSSDEVLDLLRQGNANRRTEATGANQVSSRSHAVLQVVVTRTLESGLSGGKSVRESKLSLIDLAGSERASATNNRGEQLRQGANINKSLLSLANCINALAGNRRRRGGKGPGNVKYRDSKLTHLLKASLEGRCRLVMIANVNPSHVFFDDSHNTLKYANRAKNIKVDPKTMESVRGASRLMTDKEAKMAKEYEALKERNQAMEAQLESLRNSRGYIAPEPAGFTDLFAPNTSSIIRWRGSRRSWLRRGLGEESVDGFFVRTFGVCRVVGWRGGETWLGMIYDCSSSYCVMWQVRGRIAATSYPFFRNTGKGKSFAEVVQEEVSCALPGGARLVRQSLRDFHLSHPSLFVPRVCELEGKVRELESSMARMDAQHDVNMELIGTFRHQKETAEEAAECERATADELLALLKEKETEVSQLRWVLPRTSSRSSTAFPDDFQRLSKQATNQNHPSDQTLNLVSEKSFMTSAVSQSFRSGLLAEGDSSAFGPLGQIEEGRGGVVEGSAHGHGGGGEGGDSRQQVGPVGRKVDAATSTASPSFAAAAGAAASATSSAEIASVISSKRRKSSMIPRSRKSMIPAPRSSGRSGSSRRWVGRKEEFTATRLNDHLSGGGSGTPRAAAKKALAPRTATPVQNGGSFEAGSNRCNSGNGSGILGEMAAPDDDAAAGARRGKVNSRRVSSRSGQTPQRQTVAGRTRSRLSMAPASSLRGVR
ncbi:unnamed protein product [Scytosiphon promiscuus]